jgi:hypothetical protein
MRPFLPVQVFLALLAVSVLGAVEPLALSVRSEAGERFRYAFCLRNTGDRPVTILAFESFEAVPWTFGYRAKGSPGLAESRKRKTMPYLIIEADCRSHGDLLLILPGEKARESAPPDHDAKDQLLVVAGGGLEFFLEFPGRPVRVVLRYYLWNESKVLESRQVKIPLP